MCLLTIALPGATQHRDDLDLACVNNPDGFGYAVHAGNRILTGRGMIADEVIDRYVVDRRRFPEGPALFHARLATHGAENVENCHPFRVGGDGRIVLAHNGILPITVPTTERRSDTRIYAEDILPKLGVTALDDPVWTRKTENWLGGNRVAILSASPKLTRPLYLLNEALGDWERGIWWSNDSYRTIYAPWTPIAPDAELLDICEVCGAPLSDASLVDDVCEYCDSCLWCASDADECLCRPPARSSSRSADEAWWLGHVDEPAAEEVAAV